MARFIIERTFSVSEGEMPAVNRRSKRLIAEQFPEVVWDHSHVAINDDGTVTTYCIYDAPDEETVRKHAETLGEHQYSIREIAGDVTPSDFPLEEELTH